MKKIIFKLLIKTKQYILLKNLTDDEQIEIWNNQYISLDDKITILYNSKSNILKNLTKEEVDNIKESISQENIIKLSQLRKDYLLIKDILVDIDFNKIKMKRKEIIILVFEVICCINNMLLDHKTINGTNKAINMWIDFKEKLVNRFKVKESYCPEPEVVVFDVLKGEQIIKSLLINNDWFRNMFFDNIECGYGKDYSKIYFDGDFIFEYNDLLSYVIEQKEFQKKYLNRNYINLFNRDWVKPEIFLRFPDDKKGLVANLDHKVNDTFETNKNKNKNKKILEFFFPGEENKKMIDKLVEILFSSKTNDEDKIIKNKMEKFINIIVKDKTFFDKTLLIAKNYFNDDILMSIDFINKYHNTDICDKLVDLEIPENKKNEIIEKLVFLSSSNRLTGIDNFNSIESNSLGDIKKRSYDKNERVDSNLYFRPVGKQHDTIFKYEKEILIIDESGQLTEYDAGKDHSVMFDKLCSEKYKDIKLNLVAAHKAYLISSKGNVVFYIENDMVCVYLPEGITKEQHNSLIKYLKENELKGSLYYCGFTSTNSEDYTPHNVLNNGEEMNKNELIDELFKIKTNEESEEELNDVKKHRKL